MDNLNEYKDTNGSMSCLQCRTTLMHSTNSSTVEYRTLTGAFPFA
jgi:hypothetical protein